MDRLCGIQPREARVASERNKLEDFQFIRILDAVEEKAEKEGAKKTCVNDT